MANTQKAGIALATLITLGLAVHSASAQQLVTNGTFEAGDDSTSGQGNAAGWDIVDNSGNSTGGAFQTSYTGDIGSHYTGYAGGVAPAAQGNFAAFINNNLAGAQMGGTSGFANGYQFLGTLVGGDTYTVSGLVGNRSDNAIDALGSISLVQASSAGVLTSTVLATTTIAPTLGTFLSGTYTFTASAAQDGTPFGVELTEAQNTTGPNAGFVASQVDFDNVSVVAAAPEPSEFAGLALGALGLAGLAFKARKARLA